MCSSDLGERLAVITATGDQFLLDARSGLATAPTRSLPEMPGGAAARFAGDRLSVVGWSAGAWTWTDGATTRKIRGSAENRTDARALVTDGGVFVDDADLRLWRGDAVTTLPLPVRLGSVSRDGARLAGFGRNDERRSVGDGEPVGAQIGRAHV